MAQTTTAPSTETKFKDSRLEVFVHGVIKAVEQIKSQRGDFYANRIIIPAKDTLHRPTEIVINSRMPMGREESEIETTAFLSASSRFNNGRWFNQLSLWDQPAR
ncbi:hypothetical protein [Desulfofustis glycolicus]|uniref:Uncharacterized protein n=1 Tax=Desulfofustis glycolicus DSM 9705 TaxID=1121409 RepID=A0A1M5SG34_9BACT|nr:hypothetical protein [Desulfofustis glycolicus]SHH37451.1 hypothetical protein SAMN02745124_00331 [Desulfofustis glycolicus DSM 9705]